jgi:hypothetical protein
MSKRKFKLVTDFPVTEYRCAVRVGERVRLKQELVIRDRRGKPTGKIHPPGEVWTVLRGSAEEPRVVWLREPEGTDHTWDDDEDFWEWFERVRD